MDGGNVSEVGNIDIYILVIVMIIFWVWGKVNIFFGWNRGWVFVNGLN